MDVTSIYIYKLWIYCYIISMFYEYILIVLLDGVTMFVTTREFMGEDAEKYHKGTSNHARFAVERL